MGGFHARVLRDLGYDVTTVDPDPARQADFSTLDGLFDSLRGPRDVAVYLTPRAQETFDVAAVAVPPERLVETAYRLAGVAHLLVEKPFALNTRDARMLAAYLHECGSQVAVGLVERFNPQVVALRQRVSATTPAKHIEFVRWNDRASFDVDLDLKLHDVDLWSHLAPFVGTYNVTFDARAETGIRARRIAITYGDDSRETIDLMDHDQSPLHALWFAFLTGRKHPKPSDVIQALEVIERMRESERCAA